MRRNNSFAWQMQELLFPFDVSCSLCAAEAGMGNGSGICSACRAALPYCHSIVPLGHLDCHSAFFHQDNARKMIVNLKFNG